MKKTIKTNWADYMKNYKMVLFNEYPELVRKCEAYDDIPPEVYADDEDGEPAEIYQWYIIAIDEYEAEAMARETDGVVKPFYSELVGNYILPVYHWGTPWDGVGLEITREA